MKDKKRIRRRMDEKKVRKDALHKLIYHRHGARRRWLKETTIDVGNFVYKFISDPTKPLPFKAHHAERIMDGYVEYHNEKGMPTDRDHIKESLLSDDKFNLEYPAKVVPWYKVSDLGIPHWMDENPYPGEMRLEDGTIGLDPESDPRLGAFDYDDCTCDLCRPGYTPSWMDDDHTMTFVRFSRL